MTERDTKSTVAEVSIARDEQLTQSLETLVAIYEHDRTTLSVNNPVSDVYDEILERLRATLASADRVGAEALTHVQEGDLARTE